MVEMRLTRKIAEQFLVSDGYASLELYTELDVDAAERLTAVHGRLELDGLTSLSEPASESLADHHGCLSLAGLTSLSAVAARSLSRHRGELVLDGLAELPDDLAEILSQSVGGALFLNGVATLSDTAASCLAQHEGFLSLNGLKTLSNVAAGSFSQHKGDVSLGYLIGSVAETLWHQLAPLQVSPEHEALGATFQEFVLNFSAQIYLAAGILLEDRSVCSAVNLDFVVDLVCRRLSESLNHGRIPIAAKNNGYRTLLRGVLMEVLFKAQKAVRGRDNQSESGETEHRETVQAHDDDEFDSWLGLVAARRWNWDRALRFLFDRWSIESMNSRIVAPSSRHITRQFGWNEATVARQLERISRYWDDLLLHPNAVRSLVIRLERGSEGDRVIAADRLGRLGDLLAVRPLILHLQDESHWVRRYAADALGTLGDLRAVEPLIAVLLKFRHEGVRESAARALGKLHDARAIEPLERLLDDKSDQVRSAATQALDHLKAA